MNPQLIEHYYERLAARKGWEDLLATDVTFTMPDGKRIAGKEAFVAGNDQFLRGVRNERVKERLFDGETACVWVSYGLVSPQGKQTTQDVLEIWTAKDGKLASLQVYFDTAAFGAFMQS